MLARVIGPLSAATMNGLQRNAERVSKKAGRRAQYEVAKRIFSAKTPAHAFREVRQVLDSNSHLGCCYYCERDRYRDVDHVLPQSVYPNLAFEWENYVYACTICNQDAKRHKCAVVSIDGDVTNCEGYAESDDDVPDGETCLINPRKENPLDFFGLDFETGVLTPHATLTAKAKAKAEYTLSTLRLNADALLRTRRSSFTFYMRTLEAMHAAVNDNDEQLVQRLSAEISEFIHPTVLVEIGRQSEDNERIGALMRDIGILPAR